MSLDETQTVTLAWGKDRQSREWTNKRGTIEQLLEELTREPVPLGPKDGKAFLQGEVVGHMAPRIATNMAVNHLLMTDIDTGADRDEVITAIKNTGLWAFVWSTFSHLKTVSTVPDKRWVAAKRGLPAGASDLEVARSILAERRAKPELVASISAVTRRQEVGGIVYHVTHAPMPRWRALFVLAKPFVFAEQKDENGEYLPQAEAIRRWKDCYSGFCDDLGLPWDASCQDPSRLMYAPRVGTAADQELHESFIIGGRALDLTKYVGKSKADPFAAFQVLGGGGTKHDKSTGYVPVTRNLLRFVKQYGTTFRITEWLSEVDPDGERGRPEKGGVEWGCPNEENHTVPDPADRGFWVKDGENDEGFVASCRHNTCIEASRNDRVWYLDRLCVQHGVEDAMSLMEWTDESEAGPEGEVKGALTRDQAISNLRNKGRAGIEGECTWLEGEGNREGPEYENRLQVFIDVLAEHEEGVWYEGIIDRIVTTGALTRGSLSRLLRKRRKFLQEDEERRQEAERTNAAVVQEQEFNPETYDGSVKSWWHADKKTAVIDSIIRRKNKKNPKLFKDILGNTVRILEDEGAVTGGGVRLVEVSTGPEWLNLFSEYVVFEKVADTFAGQEIAEGNGGELVRTFAPQDVIAAYVGGHDIGLPILERIVKTPILAPDGTVRTEPGYDPSSRTYLALDEGTTFLPVPENITDAEVCEDVEVLLDVIEGFPFSDSFDGTESLSIRDPETGGVNWKRGPCSRANALAMLLQPFLEGCIQGARPIYHLDKPAPGTGATYLINVVSTIYSGHVGAMLALPGSEEEMVKLVTTLLKNGETMLVFDNVNHKVDSASLAGATTSGKWKGRVLGSSTSVDINIRASWIMAGNNMSFSQEMCRRVVPIRLDADVANPAQARKPSDFKHFPLQKYVEENRPRLVRAVHGLLRNWVLKGMGPGKSYLGSFDAWSATMGGVLEAAAVSLDRHLGQGEGEILRAFLGTQNAYLETSNEDGNEEQLAIEKLVAVYPHGTSFSAQDAAAALSGGGDAEGLFAGNVGASLDPKYGLTVNKGGSPTHVVGRWLKRSVLGRTFKLEDGRQAKLANKRMSNNKNYVWTIR